MKAAAEAGRRARIRFAAVAGWQISLRFSPDVLMAGMDPLAFIRYLTTFGTISELTVVDEELPRLSKLNPHKCYLGFEIDAADAAKAVSAWSRRSSS